MYLVVDTVTRSYIFTEQDPRDDGYEGPVVEDVQFEELDTVNLGSQYSTAAVPCLGQSTTEPQYYRVFESMKQCRHAGFEPCGSVYAKYKSWSDFLQD